MKKQVYYITEYEGCTEITVIPKEYWDAHHKVQNFKDNEVEDFLGRLGFTRDIDSLFVGEDYTVEELEELLKDNKDFVYDKEFAKYYSVLVYGKGEVV